MEFEFKKIFRRRKEESFQKGTQYHVKQFGRTEGKNKCLTLTTKWCGKQLDKKERERDGGIRIEEVKHLTLPTFIKQTKTLGSKF